MAFKKITDYTGIELNCAIDNAITECGSANLDFYRILAGVDAYMERRKRKISDHHEAAKETDTPTPEQMLKAKP